MIFAVVILLGLLTSLDAATHGALLRTLDLDPLRPREWWRVGSYGLVHAGFAHCAVNAAGLRLELKRCRDDWAMSRSWPWLVLVAGVVNGGLFSFCWSSISGRTTPTAGISAGIFALWFATGARALVDRDAVAWTGVLIMVLVSAGLHFVVPLDDAAHAGGAAMGFVVGLCVAERKF